MTLDKPELISYAELAVRLNKLPDANNITQILVPSNLDFSDSMPQIDGIRSDALGLHIFPSTTSAPFYHAPVDHITIVYSDGRYEELKHQAKGKK
jgi:hypothetical protein